jgi:DNA repair exonuclease SbcCD ATPase subunit
MADLEQAATEALEKVRSLTALTDKAHERLAELADEIESAGERVEVDWSVFVERGQALLGKAGEANERMGNAAAEARGAVATLQAQIAQADGDFHGALEAARDETLALGRSLTDAVPDVTSLAETVVRTTQELTSAADEIENAFQETMEAARAFVQDAVAEDLGHLQEQVAERTQQLMTVAGECVEQMQESFASWDEGLTEVETEVAEAFDETRDHMSGLVDVAIRLSRQAHLEPLKQVESQVEQLEQLLAEVAAAAEESEEQAAAPTRERTAAMEADRAALEAVRARLDEVKALLAAFTFVEM